MSYKYLPPHVPPGYEGDEALFEQHQQLDADERMHRHSKKLEIRRP